MGRPLKMADYMKEDFRAIYDNPAGTRRAIISRGRKNAKTTESAMILLLHLCGPEARANSSIYSAAKAREQAGVLHGLAAKMIRMSPALKSVVAIRDTKKELYCPELGILYRALSADAPTAYGLSPVLIIHDEIGQVRGPKSDLYEALETATAAQENPLSIVISTQAPNDADLLSTLIDDARTGADPRTVLRLAEAPDHLDTFSEEAIRAANPAFDLFMNKAEVLGMAEDARRLPSRQPEFENLILNRRVSANQPFVSRLIWNECAGEVQEDFTGRELFAGLDLSSTSDLTAFVRVARIDGIWQVRPTFWLPEQGLAEKSRQDGAPYELWASKGHLNTTPGRSIQYEYIAHLLFKEHQQTPFRKIAFDAWNWEHLKPWLLRAGFSEEELEGDLAIFKPFRQGFGSMSPALRTLEGLVLNGELAHGGHPVLSMCAAHATVQMDPAGNRKLVKTKSHGRIDGMVALAMAVAVAEASMPAPGPSVYESRGALVL